MSKFITKIPVDVEAVRALLPSKAYFAGARFIPEENCVAVEWEDDFLVTPFLYPVSFPVENLQTKKLPEGVTCVLRVKPGAKPASAVAVVATTGPERVDRSRASRGKKSATPSGVQQ